MGGEHIGPTTIAEDGAVANRFIPAWAGNTHLLRRGSSSDAAGSSPRGRGTLRNARAAGVVDDGSSPRGRGTHSQPPRFGTLRFTGSSPRGRGTRLPTTIDLFGKRFIPAWAGNTHYSKRSRTVVTVHPRVGGEHVDLLAPLSGELGQGSSPRGRGTPALRRDSPNAPRLFGSSPRGRGTRSPCPLRRPTNRFIPAWAGNTGLDRGRLGSQSVHPRVGGEHSYQPMSARARGGSSPRGRGTPCTRSRPAGQERFIPAWAGNTAPGPRSAWGPSVHPRVGGEHLRLEPSEYPRTGSSPRGRGTRAALAQLRPYRRFIPAWAGNT